MAYCEGDMPAAAKSLNEVLTCVGPQLLDLVIDYTNLDLQEDDLDLWQGLNCSALRTVAVTLFCSDLDCPVSRGMIPSMDLPYQDFINGTNPSPPS